LNSSPRRGKQKNIIDNDLKSSDGYQGSAHFVPGGDVEDVIAKDNHVVRLQKNHHLVEHFNLVIPLLGEDIRGGKPDCD